MRKSKDRRTLADQVRTRAEAETLLKHLQAKTVAAISARRARKLPKAGEQMCDCGKSVAECIKSPGAAHRYVPPSTLREMSTGLVIVDVRDGETEEAARSRVAKQIASKDGPPPCEYCGRIYTREGGSRLNDGTWIHVPCPKRAAAIRRAQAAAVERDREALAAGRRRAATDRDGLGALSVAAGRRRATTEPEPDYGFIKPFSSHSDLGMLVHALRTGDRRSAPDDGGGRIYLQLHRGTRNVLFTKLEVTGLSTAEMSIEKFERTLRPMLDRGGREYSVRLVCEGFKKVALAHGATQGVLNHLARVVPFTKEEIEMATKKAQSTSSSAGAAPKGPKQKGSGERIREMIMENRKTTEEILAVIHKEFPGSKAKSSDVSWNRGWLIKHGQKPPESKGRQAAPSVKSKPAKGAAAAKGKPAKGKAPRAA